MNDSIKANRSYLKNRKALKDIYSQEAKSMQGTYNMNDVRERVKLHLKRQKIQSIISKVFSILFFSMVCIGIFFSLKDSHPHKKNESKKKIQYFKTVYYDQNNGYKLKVDYFKFGPKAATTKYKDGHKHQNSESYYATGEQFRSALFFYDTLIVDYYFYKSGDTIKNFPILKNNKVYPIQLIDKKENKQIEFDYFDGKVLYGSYNQYPIE